MVVSKRERTIALVAAGALAFLVLYEVVISPYIDERERVTAALVDADNTRKANQDITDSYRRKEPIWLAMQKGGLKPDIGSADSQAQAALDQYLRWSGVGENGLIPRPLQRSPDHPEFQVQSYDVSGTGSMRQISNFIWALETASIPLRITEIQITPRKEGSDDLAMRLVVSTLSKVADARQPGQSAGTPAGGQR